VVIGSNQENAAYPSGLCAERVTIFQAGAAYPKQNKEWRFQCIDTNETSTTIPVVLPTINS
jgi:cytidine deaminase